MLICEVRIIKKKSPRISLELSFEVLVPIAILESILKLFEAFVKFLLELVLFPKMSNHKPSNSSDDSSNKSVFGRLVHLSPFVVTDFIKEVEIHAYTCYAVSWLAIHLKYKS